MPGRVRLALTSTDGDFFWPAANYGYLPEIWDTGSSLGRCDYSGIRDARRAREHRSKAAFVQILDVAVRVQATVDANDCRLPSTPC